MHQIYHCRAYIIQQNRATPRHISVRFILTNLHGARGSTWNYRSLNRVRAIVHLRACESVCPSCLYLINRCGFGACPEHVAVNPGRRAGWMIKLRGRETDNARVLRRLRTIRVRIAVELPNFATRLQLCRIAHKPRSE